MQALPRYAVHDEYAVQEMILLYKSANAQKRIELLSDWYGQSTIPFEVAKLAVEDPDDSVRYWMARNATFLDYSERDDTHPERNLEARLRADPVPLVGAAVFENHHLYRIPFLDREDALAAMSQLERLAYMRNRYVSVYDAQKVADMALPLKERQDLILALLTNPTFVEYSHGVHCDLDLEFGHAKLWDTISSWPYSRAKIEFFHRVYAPGSKKTEIYKASSDEDYSVRCAILEGCDVSRCIRELDVRGEFPGAFFGPLLALFGVLTYRAWDVLELGTTDTDPHCRELAYSKLPVNAKRFRKKLRKVLKGSDKAAILGLYSNPKVTAAQLDAIGWRVGELHLSDEVRWRREPTTADVILDRQLQLPGTFARYGAYAWNLLGGLVVFGLSLRLLSASHEGQRVLLSLLIIACCTIVLLADSLRYRLGVVDDLAAHRLNELKKLLGAKDLIQSEARTLVEAEHMRHFLTRISIRGPFLAAACLLALGGLILSVLR